MRYAVITQNLYNLMRTDKEVNPFQFKEECETLYDAIKCVGIENLDITYKTKDGIKEKVAATNLTDIAKAVAAFPVVLKYRWTDLDQGRLARHYQMDSGITTLLMNLSIFKGSGLDLKVTNIQEFMQAYKKTYACHMNFTK